MSGIKLKPIDGGDIIDVPIAKTVIGRGPFLKVVDKKVSRNHGILEIEDNKLYLTPTHSNPCFCKKDSMTTALQKDKRKLLQDGDVFGLLPDKLFFQVIQNVSNGSAKSDDVKDESSRQEEITSGSKTKGDGKLSKEKVKSERKIVQPPGKQDMTMPLEKTRVLPSWLIQVANSSPAVPKKSPKKSPVKSAAEPPPRKKKVSESEEDWEEEEEVKPKARGKKIKKKYSSDNDDDNDDDYEEERKPKKKGRKKYQESSEEEEESESEDDRRKKRRKTKNRYSSDERQSTSKHRPSRSAAQQRGSYVDDFVVPDDLSDEEEESVDEKDNDSDFILPEENEDSGSDWEMANKKGKGRSFKKPVRSSKRRGRKKRYGSDFSDEEDDEEYVPRRTKRRASAAASSKFKRYDDSEESDFSEEEYVPKRSAKKGRGTPAKRKGRKQSDSEDDDSESEDKKKKTKGSKRGKKKKESESEEEESEDSEEDRRKKKKQKKKDIESDNAVESAESEENTSKRKAGHDDDESNKSPVKKKKEEVQSKAKPKRRKRCMFGKKCYRKNPDHFKQFCHPGDESYEVSEEEDDRLGIYGLNSSRKNTQQRKDISKTNNPIASFFTGKRDRILTKKNDDEDDEGLPNTYDYKDSFIDDENVSESEESDFNSGGEDSDWNPEDSQNIRDLKKEAKEFKKNKKLQKPTRNK